MKILFILQYVPYPLDSGGNQATFNMIDKIRHIYDVSVLFYLKSTSEEDAMHVLQTIWNDVTFYSFKPGYLKGGISQKAQEGEIPDTISYRFFNAIRRSMDRKMARRIRKFRIENKSLSFTSEYTTTDFVKENACLNKEIPNFPSEFHNYVYDISRKGFDLIQVEFYECLQLVYLLPKEVKKIFVQHEIRFIRNKNELDLFQEKTPDDVYRYLLRKDLEVKLLSYYDCIIVLTEVDKQILLAENPNLNIYVSPAVVSKDFHTAIDYKPAEDFVFIGGGYHFPNADGLIWFCSNIVPLLLKEKKMQKLYVVGFWSEEIKKYIERIYPEICFTGFVEDLSSFISGKISIIPIRIGSGMRMKILDSIVASSPIVTTSKGCEGLPVTNGKNCLIADTAEDFAQALMQLTGNVEIQRKLVVNARQEFASVFDFEEQIQRRMALYAHYADSIKK